MKRGARSSPPSSAAGSGGDAPEEEKGAGYNTASTAMLLSLVAAIIALSSCFAYVMSAVLQPGVGVASTVHRAARGASFSTVPRYREGHFDQARPIVLTASGPSQPQSLQGDETADGLSLPSMTVAAISDTHGQHRKLHVPEGEVLIVGGDFTDGLFTTREQVQEFDEWMHSLHFTHKLLVSGNHDVLSPDDTQGAVPLRSLLRFTELIDDELVTVELDSRDGLREVTIYGLPWQPQYGPGNQLQGDALRAKIAAIPTGVDILVTHGPPRGIGDADDPNGNVGDDILRAELEGRIRPKLHLFGHFHGGSGLYVNRMGEHNTTHVNTAMITLAGEQRLRTPWRFAWYYDDEDAPIE